MFGIVAVVGTYYIQAAPLYLSPSDWLPAARALPLNAFVLGLPVGALVVNVLLIDDIRDHVPDKAKGWRTGSVRFGIAWTRFEIAVLTVFSYVIPFWFWLGRGFSPWVLLPLLTLPLAIRVARVISTRDRFEDLFPMTPKAASLALIYAALLAIGIAL
jgi:1,4-dihydroxy-2-naphthoate octaprenyltransferase